MAIAKGVKVRRATAADAEQIARLSEELGYPATAAESLRRLADIGGHGEHAVMAAEREGMVLGWIHVLVSHSLVAGTRGEIAGLVVGEQHRGCGIGRLLMEEAEQWVRSQGCGSLRLHSNVLRTGAHAFYDRLGYKETKLQKVFRKELG